MKRQIHCFYSGRVQGVGFRFTAQNLAEKAHISGWVRNLPGGNVELVAQAEENPLREYIDSLQNYFNNYITKTDVSWEEPMVELSVFEVKF